MGALPTLWEALPSVAVVPVARGCLKEIVTRRPLVLQLHKTEAESTYEYARVPATFCPEGKFTDFGMLT
ncbi:hypothetical protein J5N97_025115 [Dioscorea zingiberensis]|uniref:Uncharacterized protein n=1 Tax=Dioscorea zingiberensis TaxID=325984 RepID=A0A9D5C8D4_9LILI|nr:hypothetical protein J5N97_025115 [Dioscorea zingiberensis]